MTLPNGWVWSLTVMLCRQQGRQSEARGRDISSTIGDPSSSIMVRVKGRLEEKLQSKHQQLQSQQMQGFLAHHRESSLASRSWRPVFASFTT